MLTVEQVTHIVDASLNQPIDRLSAARDHMSYAEYISQFRTITIGVPRRSGKSTVAEQYARGKSSAIIVPNMSIRGTCFRDSRAHVFTVDELNQRILWVGRNNKGLRYQCFIVDDVITPYLLEQFYAGIELLRISDMLTDDFYVLRLETSR